MRDSPYTSAHGGCKSEGVHLKIQVPSKNAGVVNLVMTCVSCLGQHMLVGWRIQITNRHQKKMIKYKPTGIKRK